MEITKKILIVDDRPDNIVALQMFLKRFDAQIISATSGNEALTKTLEHEFALALIDVQMPDMDGYETVKLMRQVEKTRYLPVIFLSAIYSEDHYMIQGIEAGAVDFITKPFPPQILIGKVKTFLEMYEQKKKLEIEIEQRKQTEASLRETEQELLRAKEKAEQADKLKTAFLANMSHEIRTPLNAIVGFANLLAEDELSPDRKQQYLSYVYNSSDTLLNIINDILDIAKIEAGQLKINKTPVNVDNLLRELWITFKEEQERKGKSNIELKLQWPEKPYSPVIDTDESRLRQVFSNLLQNSLKFTLHGSIEFGYVIRENEIEFFVKDTGIGIAEEQIEMVFDRFQKVQNDKVQNATGTGLGLSIVKRILELLDGRIWVESKINEGSKFYFSLPYSKETGKRTENLPDESVRNQENVNWSSKNILIAEDEQSNYQLLEAILIPTKAHIKWAKNGREAVEAFKNEKIDAVLMDIKMPVMSGFEAYQEIRKMDKHLPIIAQTAYAMMGEREKFEEIGFNGYITKPIVKKELLQVLNSVLA